MAPTWLDFGSQGGLKLGPNGIKIDPKTVSEASSALEPILDRFLIDLGLLLDRFGCVFWSMFGRFGIDIWLPFYLLFVVCSVPSVWSVS